MAVPKKAAAVKKAAAKPVVAEPVAAEEPVVVLEPAEPEAVTDVPAEPAPVASETVRFVCDQWAGVRLHGKNIKFEDHVFVTDDPVKVAVLDAWPHARRDA